MKTTDARANWETVNLEGDYGFYSIHFFDPDTGLISGSHGAVLAFQSARLFPRRD